LYKYLANTLFLGKNLIYLPTCHSTNDIARQLVDKNQAPEGTIVITNNQSAGKGQRGNSWQTEPGENLTFSMIYFPHFLTAEGSFWFTIITSLALREALESYGIQIKIKWPNDIYVGKKKLGGILIENVIDNRKINFSIIGIGLNVNQQHFNVPDAISLYNITNRNYNLQNVLEEVSIAHEQLYLQLKKGRYDHLKSLYLKHLLGINEELKFKIDGDYVAGVIRGIDDVGRLKLELAGTIEYFSFKEIKFILN
jgi:BirA family biotin operon repressor/biotin-[acetyl-CoA-carboxylase] ligase